MLAAALAALLVASRADARSDERAGPRVVVLGNSILHAVGASEPSRGSAALLAAELGGRVDGVEEWVGDGASLRARLDDLIVGPAPALVVVHTATRDLAAPVDEALAATRATLDRIAAAWHAPVVVMGPWGTEPDHPLDRGLAAALAGRAGYASVATVFADPELHRGGDDWHPNDAGHREIARRLLAATRDRLPWAVATPTSPVGGQPVPPLAPTWLRAHLPLSPRAPRAS